MIEVNIFNSIDIIFQYGYEKFRDNSKSFHEQIIHISNKILELNLCIYDNEFHISLNEAKMAAELAKENIKNI